MSHQPPGTNFLVQEETFNTGKVRAEKQMFIQQHTDPSLILTVVVCVWKTIVTNLQGMVAPVFTHKYNLSVLQLQAKLLPVECVKHCAISHFQLGLFVICSLKVFFLIYSF